MGTSAGQMGARKSFTDRKISGFSAKFATRKSGLGKMVKANKGPDYIKGPRQAFGSRGDGMNGGN